MVEPIPTFRSERVTQAGNNPVVSFDGTRQMGAAMSGVGKVFDQITAFQDKKANERAEREMKRQGEEVARMKGFDPAELKDPVTAADEIYRQAALQTYSISLESSITNKVNDAYVRNMRNPEGFKRETQAFVEKTAASVPWELKNGVAKLGSQAIDQRYTSMRIENQKLALAEMEKAEEIYLGNLTDQFALAKTPEEKQVINEKIKSTIAGSSTYLTQAGKMAAYQDATKKMIYASGFNEVVQGEKTPSQILDEFAAQGIAPTNEMVGQLYSAAGRQFTYETAQYKNNENKRKQAVSEAKNTLLLEINKYKGGEGFDDIYNMIQAKSDAIILSSGGDAEDLTSFRAAAQKIAFGSQEDNPQVKLMLDSAIFYADPKAKEKIDQALQTGGITPSTYQEYIEKETTARAGINSNPVLKKWIENEYIPQYAPLARKATPGWENAYENQLQKQDIAGDKAQVDAIISKAVALSQTMPMGDVVKQLSSDIRANETITPAKQRAAILGDSPNRKVIEDMYSRDNFEITYVDLKTKKRGTYSESNAPSQYKEILKGPWTQSNYLARTKLMITQNTIANSIGLTPPYSDEFMKEVLQTWQ